MGLPVVDVTEEPSGMLKFSPKRFLTDPDADPNVPEEPKYK